MWRPALVAAVLVAVASAAAGGHASTRLTLRPAWSDEVTLSSKHAARVPTSVRRTSTWCGTTSPTDRPPVATGYPIHVYYAYPAGGGGTDQSATVAPQIEDMIDQIDAWWQREDPSREPRFDMYAAPCGPQVDLQVLPLSVITTSTGDPHLVYDQVWSQLQTQPDAATSKYLVFVDQVNTGNVCGVGGPADDATLGGTAMGVATVLLASCSGADLASVAAHELLHAVTPASGFVGSPHTCPGDLFHVCDSNGDVLYPYTEIGSHITSIQLDVGHDDYWAGTAPVNLQVQPWFIHTQDQAQLALTVGGQGTVTSDIPGLDCTASCSTSWDRGDALNLAAAPGAGERFVRWSGGCTGSASCSLTLDAAKQVGALFAPATFGLTVQVRGSGAVTSRPGGLACRSGACSKPFTSYVPVVLTEKPAKGWRFTGWSGACHGTRATCSVAMTAPAAARATFAKKRA